MQYGNVLCGEYRLAVEIFCCNNLTTKGSNQVRRGVARA
jgi:hypothetical protein